MGALTPKDRVCVMFSKDLSYTCVEILSDNLGRYQTLKVGINDISIILVDVYGPSNDAPEFYEELFAQLNGINLNNCIIGGDFNLILSDALGKDGAEVIGVDECRHAWSTILNP